MGTERKRRWREGWMGVGGGGSDYSREAIILNITIKGARP